MIDMTLKTVIEFRRVFIWNGKEYTRGEQMAPAKLGMSIDEARNLESNHIVKIIEKQV